MCCYPPKACLGVFSQNVPSLELGALQFAPTGQFCVCMLRSLTDEPGANDTITLFVTAFGLEGNTIDVEPLLQYDKGVHNLTHANYGHQYHTRINVTGAPAAAAL